jgi:hypothetical protein
LYKQGRVISDTSPKARYPKFLSHTQATMTAMQVQMMQMTQVEMVVNVVVNVVAVMNPASV